MNSTKTGILGLLKRNGGSTVDGLASKLNLAPMTVRQHLTALERDALVKAEEVRRPTGRPHYLYRLTGDGHRSVADGHDRMLGLLVEQAGLLDSDFLVHATPAERRGLLFERAGRVLAERHRAEVTGLTQGQQLDRATAVLRAHGGFAEWQEQGGVYELRDFACVYRGVVATDGPCIWHESFLIALIDAPIAPAEGPADCALCCRYTIKTRDATESEHA